MQPDSTPKIIEELKAAGEELKNTPLPEFDGSEKNSPAFKSKAQQVTPKAKEEKIDLLKKITKYQEEIAQEQSALEKTYQEVKELKRKLENRIELLQRLQTKSKEFQDEITLAQKESPDFLEEIKNKLNSSLPPPSTVRK